jgi:ligand-binding SRPBCC domain-containing protein
MPNTIVETIAIHAPIDRCFALSTRVELVQRTLGMKLISGVTKGHITANSRVVWRGWKFGLPTEHHTLITGFKYPHDGAAYFEDSQERGRFATFRHEHFFLQEGDTTQLEDRIHFTLPFGAIGHLPARFLLTPHIRKLARKRFAMIKELAESEDWRQWLN